ncbi:MAG: antitoxin [Vicinamibacteria bacterium]
MRTTLDIDDDVLLAAKELASAQKKTAGKVISELAREAIRGGRKEGGRIRNGFVLLPSGGAIVTSELVEKLLEEEP